MRDTLIKVAIIAVAIIAAVYGASKYNSLKNELEVASNNIVHYENQYIGVMNDKAVLELNAARLRHSNDYLVQKYDSLAKSRKINVSKPGTTIAGTTTVIDTRDSVKIVYVDTTSCDFDVNIRPNDLTHYHIQLVNDTLIHEAKIINEQVLFVYPNREYINNYKTFIGRLFRLDFKKRDITRYQIVNSNDEVDVKDSKVIIVNE